LGWSDLFASQRSESPQQVLLLVIKVSWNHYVEDNDQVPAPSATESRHAASPHPDLTTRLRSLRNGQVLGAVECVDRNRGAESRLGNADRNSRHDIDAVSFEPIIRSKVQSDE